jgi:hypothetical protein
MCLASFGKDARVSAAHKRLRPGELEGLVLSYLCKHDEDGPLTPTAVAKGIGRSAGAVSNCLARLVKAKKVRLAKKSSPRLRSPRGKGAVRTGRPGRG